MGSTPEVRKLTAAYVAMLEQVTGRLFGDLDAPGTLDTPAVKPYGVVQHLAGGLRFGDVARPNGMATVIYQVTAVGERADQAEWLADLVTAATLDLNSTGFANNITAAGLTVIGREFDLDGGVQTDGALVNATRRYALTVTAP